MGWNRDDRDTEVDPRPAPAASTVGLTPELRAMLDTWQRGDLQRVKATRKLLGMDDVMTEAEWARRAVKRERVSSAEDLTDP